jgi:hypothetical protein
MTIRKMGFLLVALMLGLSLFGCDRGGDSPESEADPVGSDSSPGVQEPSAGSDDKTASDNGTVSGEGNLTAADQQAVAEGKTVKVVNSYYATLAEAVEFANQNGGGTIYLLADTTCTASDQPPMIEFRTTVRVKSVEGEIFTIKRGEGQTFEMFRLTDGVVTFDNVIFDGTSSSAVDRPILVVSNLAWLTLGSGAVLKNNNSNDRASAISVSGADAKLTIQKGCTIENCSGAGSVIFNDGATIVDEGVVLQGNMAAEGDYGGSPITS